MPKQVSYTESTWGSYFMPEDGGYPAIVVWVMEMGTESRDFNNDGKFKDVTEFRLVFEIEAEQEGYDSDKKEKTWVMSDVIGLVGQNYNEIVSDRSKLWKAIKAIYDVKEMSEIKNFSMDKLLWLKCYIELEKGYVKWVSSLNKKMESMLHEQVRKNFYFGMEDPDDYSQELLDDKTILKPWDKDRIENSPEFAKLFNIERIEDQEENMKAEAEEKKTQPEVTTDDVEQIFEAKEAPVKEEKTKTEENPFG